MKRVCTLRKVLRSLSKVLLEKLFYRSYISWLFIATQFLLFLYVVAFCRHSVLVVYGISPAGRYAMEWKGNPKYLHEKKFFSILLPHLPHAY